MAMDFFEHQEVARKRTGLLVLLFALAVLAIVAATCAVIAVFFAAQGLVKAPDDAGFAQRLAAVDWRIIAIAGAVTLLLVGGASAVKLAELRAGGAGIAERLGGRLLSHDSNDPAERRALNVVEEMAIASGVPVPPVYLMEDEPAINAFAAGYAPASAVVGLTRGCIERLSRDELQGVVAHEFSHILNGDMRLNLRLIGFLHGVLVIGLIGGVLLRSFRYGAYGVGRRRSSGRGEGGAVLAILGLGLALLILGSLGSFFGSLIKSAVSRQREYLADASAVQFTRNPGGIGGALKRIGGMSRRGRLVSPNAEEASHMYFADGVGFRFASLFATHPPLEKRIRRIEPEWDGKFPPPRHGRIDDDTAPADRAVARGMTAGFAAIQGSIDHVGRPTRDHMEAARAMLRRAPRALVRAAQEGYGAQALVYAALLDPDDDVRRRQLEAIAQHGPRGMAGEAERLAREAASLDPTLRLPLLDVAIGSLRSLTAEQRAQVRAMTERLIRADRKIGLFEWCLRRMLLRSLAEQPAQRVTHYGMQRLGKPVSITLSALAAVGGRDEAPTRSAFEAGAATLDDVATAFVPPASCSLRDLESALGRLAGLAPRHKRRLLEACAVVVTTDGEATGEETETLRAIADALDCPMPPVLLPSEERAL